MRNGRIYRGSHLLLRERLIFKQHIQKLLRIFKKPARDFIMRGFPEIRFLYAIFGKFHDFRARKRHKHRRMRGNNELRIPVHKPFHFAHQRKQFHRRKRRLRLVQNIQPVSSEAVLNQLYSILAHTQDHSLSFTDPDVQEDGTVRRNISMSFRCDSYAAAKNVIKDLTDSQWRCLVSNLSIACEEGDMMKLGVTVTATITYFESTELA